MAQNQRCGKGFGWIVSILDTSLSKKLKIQYFFLSTKISWSDVKLNF